MIAFKLTFKGDYDKVTFTANRFDASTVKTYEDENLFSYQKIAYIKIYTFFLLKQLVTTEITPKLYFCILSIICRDNRNISKRILRRNNLEAA